MERKKSKLTEARERVLYREWGIFYTRKKQLDVANNYYSIALEKSNDDPKALFNRSKCKRSISQNDEALIDAERAAELEPNKDLYNLEVCDALYNLNRFEDSQFNLYHRSQRFQGCKLKGFDDRHDVLNKDFSATIGEAWGKHILENKKYLYKAHEKRTREMIADKRPLWKILKDQDKCDVLSVLEKEPELVSPREVARRKLTLTKYMQLYLRRSWVDVLFLQTLRNHPSLMLPQCKWSTSQMKEITQKKYDSVLSFLNMLHARAPLYTQTLRRSKSKTYYEYQHRKHLFRVQYQVHRNMLNILKTIRSLKYKLNVQKLTEYVEEVMGEYVVMKTHRIMPWKFQFINEVYNILALANIKQYLHLPKPIIEGAYPYDRLSGILKMPTEKFKDQQKFVFGDRSTGKTDEDSEDQPMIRHREFIARLENRLVFSKHPIERSYLYHEMARSYLKHALYDECFSMSRKCIDEAQKCNSLVWNLLGLLLVCKSFAVLHKYEKVQAVFQDIANVSARLNDPKVEKFVSNLGAIIADHFTFQRLQVESRKKHGSKLSIMSIVSGSDSIMIF